MKKRLVEERNFFIIFIIGIVFVFVIFAAVLSDLGSDKRAEDKAQLEKAIAHAAVACYAIEGSYPPSVEYLQEHYGVRIDSRQFTVKYELYASNLMPDITVLVNDHED